MSRGTARLSEGSSRPYFAETHTVVVGNPHDGERGERIVTVFPARRGAGRKFIRVKTVALAGPIQRAVGEEGSEATYVFGHGVYCEIVRDRDGIEYLHCASRRAWNLPKKRQGESELRRE